MADLATYRTELAARVSAASTTAIQDRALREALKRYSKDRPYARMTANTAGNGTRLVAVPTDWDLGCSRLLMVEYPAAADDTTDPIWLPEDEVIVERQPAGTDSVRFLTVTPTAADNYALVYTALHTVKALATSLGGTGASSTTIPGSDDEAFLDLAAHFACEILMDGHTLTVDSTIVQDTVDPSSVFDRYEKRADRYLDRYEKAIARSRGTLPGGFISWGADRRLLMFQRVVVVSRWAPNTDRFAPFLNAVVV